MEMAALLPSHNCISLLLQTVIAPQAHLLHEYLSKAEIF